MPLFFVILFFVCSLDAQEEIPAMIHGIYGHPGPLWEQELRLDEMGINAIFVHSGTLDTATISRARRENCRVFA